MSLQMLNYEERVDCFEQTKHVKSILLYGDPHTIKKPWITVFIPTYKRADLLQQALNSVLKQWHTDFFWDILIVDNEPYTGTANVTERLIRKIDNPRILYYRNSENMRPGDNFNRGILLARGKWVMMLHDDDLLVHNTLQNMGRLIRAYDGIDKNALGAIATAYHQFKYDVEKPYDYLQEIRNANQYYCSIETQYNLYKLTHRNVIATGHIGGSVPSNGTTFLREAVLWAGGFNDDQGISADLILFYRIEKKYSAYFTRIPMGFYRWGANTMIKFESTYNTIKAGYDFREYIYKKHPVCGALLRKVHYRKFTADVVMERNRVSRDIIKASRFNDIFDRGPNRLWYFLYSHIFLPVHSRYKMLQSKYIGKKAIKRLNNEKNS